MLVQTTLKGCYTGGIHYVIWKAVPRVYYPMSEDVQPVGGSALRLHELVAMSMGSLVVV